MQRLSLKNLALLSLVLLIQGYFIYVFYLHDHIFMNLRASYITQAYVPALRYMFTHSLLAKAASPFLSSLGVTGEAESFEPPSQKMARSIPVLIYHGVVDEPDGHNLTIEDFRKHMFLLKQNGYQTVGIEDLYQFMLGKKAIPEKAIVLTFDDGRKDSFYPVDPILQAVGYRAAMFAIVKYSFLEKSNYYLTQRELRRMAETRRWDIQSHGIEAHSLYPIDAGGTVGYFYGDRLWLGTDKRLETTDEFANRITKDLQNSKSAFERFFGRTVIGFAFPFGEFGQESQNYPEAEQVIREAALAVYPLSFFQFTPGERFTQNYSREPESGTQSYFIKRISIEASMEPEELLATLQNGSAKQMPFHDDFESDRGWIGTKWGLTDHENGAFSLRARPEGTGSAAILDGSRHWKDYEITARVWWLGGTNMYLWGRYQNDHNYAACNFGKTLTHVEQSVQGERRVIRGEPHAKKNTSGPVEIKMRVVGRHVECVLDGQVIVTSDFLDRSLQSGGIGLKTWGAIPGEAYVTIDDITINEIK